jgi:hypothetical protein
MTWKPLAPHTSHLVSSLSAPNSPSITKHETAPLFFDEEQRLWLVRLLRKEKPIATRAEIDRFVEAVAASVAHWRLASAMRPAAPARQVHNAMRQLWLMASAPEPAIGLLKARLRALPSEGLNTMEVRARLLWPSILGAELPPYGLIGWSKTAAPADLVRGDGLLGILGHWWVPRLGPPAPRQIFLPPPAGPAHAQERAAPCRRLGRHRRVLVSAVDG